MNAIGANHISLTDPDTRLMISKSKTDFQFNAQAVVDHKNQIIVGSSVTNENIENYTAYGKDKED